jgi:superfamily II DNA/RNA helicase
VVLDEADALLAGSFKPAARATYPIEILISQVKRSAKEEAMRANGGKATSSARYGPRGERGASGRAVRAEAHASKQFVLTGATMPNAGTKNAQEHVKRLFPLATWFRAERVHQSNRAASHYFVKIGADRRVDALRHALKHGPEGKALVFANTLKVAEEAYEEARRELGEGVCALFHGGLPPAERAELLAAYEAGGGGGGGGGGPSPLRVLVCTGVASRGIDFVDVAHVVQYEVATNAVEFMHRVGRTARAGKVGTTTTLYTEDRADLVEGLRDALDGGEGIEHLFSRKRSFKLALKKRRKREEEGSF